MRITREPGHPGTFVIAFLVLLLGNLIRGL